MSQKIINFAPMLYKIKQLFSKTKSNTANMGSSKSRKRIGIDIGYVIAWGVITLASSYNPLLHHCSFDFIINHQGDYNDKVIPLIVWMVAYFLDYVYNTIRREEDELISISHIKQATVAITVFLFCLVIILAQSSYLQECYYLNSQLDSWLSLEYRRNLRTICLLCMFLSILLLKWGAINSLYLKNNVRKN